MSKVASLPSKSDRQKDFREALTLKCEEESNRHGLTLLYPLRSPSIPGHGPIYKAVASDGEHPPAELPLTAEDTKALREMEQYVATGERTAVVSELIHRVRSSKLNEAPLPVARIIHLSADERETAKGR